MLKCLICFILGWLVSRQMGNGFSVSCVSVEPEPDCNTNIDNLIEIYSDKNHEEYKGNDAFASRLREMYKTKKDLDNFYQCIDDKNPEPDIQDDESQRDFNSRKFTWQNSHNYRRTTFKRIVDYWWKSLN